MSVATPSVGQARACIALASVLWSLGSVFIRLLREPTSLGLNDPPLSPLQIAFFRGLFGGLAVLLLVRRSDVQFRPLMPGMVVLFALMSALYLSALGLGPAANAIFLQNTAPIWLYLIAVYVLGESAERRGGQSVVLGGLGAVVIVAGNWPTGLPAGEQAAQVLILFMGLSSGMVYSVVMLFLRALRDVAPAWLVSLNMLGTAATLALFVLASQGLAGFGSWVSVPSVGQLGVLALCGAVQMALPYWLFARGLRSVRPQEAGILSLIEPLLNPIWAYLITPHMDTPGWPMFLGGSLILAALVWRYIPDRSRKAPPVAVNDPRPQELPERNGS